MFDRYVFTENSCKNVLNNGEIVGFEMQTQLNYYRGIPCSMVQDVTVTVDGVDVPREEIFFSPDGIDYFTLSQLETVAEIKWEFGQKATVFVKRPGGLSQGSHEVYLATTLRIAYMPVPITGEKTRTVTI